LDSGELERDFEEVDPKNKKRNKSFSPGAQPGGGLRWDFNWEGASKYGRDLQEQIARGNYSTNVLICQTGKLKSGLKFGHFN
jgi:hypothetical protein